MNDQILLKKTKVCPVCKLRKSKKQFYKRSKKAKYKYYVTSSCKKCNIKRLKPETIIKRQKYMKSYCKQYYLINKDRISENNNKYYQKNKKRILKTNKELYHNDETYRLNKKCKKYKITVEEFLKFKNDQQNSCAICMKHVDDCYKGLFIDHCHETNKVRGLLCIECNLAIGYFHDDPDIIYNAKIYIEKNQ